MVSDRARQLWSAYVRARGTGTAPFCERDELHRFLVGLHLRSEVLSAAGLASLLDEAGVEGDERQALVEGIESGLALLDAYVRQVGMEDGAYEDVETFGGFEI